MCIIFKLSIILFPVNIITKSVFLTLNVLSFISISFQFSGIFCSGGNLYVVFLDLSFCCRNGDPLQGPRVGSCLTLRSELSEETQMLTEQETLLERAAPVMSKRVREPRTASWLPISVLGFMGMGLISWSSLANHSYFGSFLLVHTLLSQDGFHQGRFWEGDRTCGISFWPFPNSSSWWWLVISVFPIRTCWLK